MKNNFIKYKLLNVLLMLTVLISGNVLAVGIGNDNPGSTSTVDVSNTATNNNSISNSLTGGSQYMGGNRNDIDIGGQGQHQTNTSTNTNDLSNMGNSTSTATGGAGGNAAQHQGQGQHQSNGQNQSANNAGNSQTTNFNSSTHVARNNPNVTVFAPNPTSPCMMSFGGGGAGGGFGVMITGTVANENCEINEAARIMNSIGQPETAIEIACTGKHAKNTKLCRNVNASVEQDIKTSNKVLGSDTAETNDSSTLGFKMDNTTNQYKWVGFNSGKQ